MTKTLKILIHYAMRMEPLIIQFWGILLVADSVFQWNYTMLLKESPRVGVFFLGIMIWVAGSLALSYRRKYDREKQKADGLKRELEEFNRWNQ